MPIEEEKLSEEVIATLTGIRFERKAVFAALRSNDNNVEHAGNRLLTSTKLVCLKCNIIFEEVMIIT